MPTIRSGAASDVGRVREVNEDSILATGGIFVVADGMGGHAAGEVASGIVVDRLGRLGDRDDIRPEDVRAEIAQANADILGSAAAHPSRAGMGTTLTGISLVRFADADHWMVFNIGDSRVYRFAEDALVQITVDHSEVAELIAAGTISAAEAGTRPRRNVITRALGSDPAPEPDVWVFAATPGERFVICSDGLSLELSDADIARVVRTTSAPQRAAEVLVDSAVRAGGRDNVSVVVVDAEPDDDEPDAADATVVDAAR
jgi:PPM family protein phosphatase